MPSRRLMILLVCVALLTSSCTSVGLPVTDGKPSVTLPPAEVSFVAPIGDAALEYTDTATLYLPNRDGISLTPVETELSFSLVRPAAESIIRALIAHAGNRDVSALGGSVRLSLYGANPVEISRNVATVNLSASALKLEREQLYIVCQAIANTLTELDEINCAAVGFGEDVTVSLCEQPVSWEDFLTFDDKYMRSNSGKGMESLQRKIPAPISDQMTKTIQDMTRDVFNCLDLKGVCRIDYMIDKVTGNLYINEINTIPGSLSFYLFEPLGIYYSKLIDMMIDSAIKAHEEKQKNDFSFDSQILKKVGSGLSGAKGGKLGGKMGGSKIGKM